MEDNINFNVPQKSYRQIIQLWVEEALTILEHRSISDFTLLCSKAPLDEIVKHLIKNSELEEEKFRSEFIRYFQLFCASFDILDHQKGLSDSYVDLAKMGVLLDKGYEIVSIIIHDKLYTENKENREYRKEQKVLLQPVNIACKKAREIVQRKREAAFEYLNPLSIPA